MNKYAQRIGRLAKGKPKNFKPETIDILKQRLSEARKKRWPKNDS